MEPTERLVSVLFHLIYVAYANTKYVMDCVFLNYVWVYCMQFLCKELADMTISRRMSYSIRSVRSPDIEIFPIILATL